MTIGAVPIFHSKKVSDEMTIGAVPMFHKKKYQMKWLLEQYPFS